MSAMNAGGGVLCITGRPSSGKSTLGGHIADALRAERIPVVLLDGDAVRAALVPPPGYTEQARADFYATLTHLSALLSYQGVWVVVAATYGSAQERARLRELSPRFLEVFVDATREACEARDPKGLYRRAREGTVTALPGVSAPYEPPDAPDVVAFGGEDELAVERILTEVRQRYVAAPWHESL